MHRVGLFYCLIVEKEGRRHRQHSFSAGCVTLSCIFWPHGLRHRRGWQAEVRPYSALEHVWQCVCGAQVGYLRQELQKNKTVPVFRHPGLPQRAPEAKPQLPGCLVSNPGPAAYELYNLEGSYLTSLCFSFLSSEMGMMILTS